MQRRPVGSFRDCGDGGRLRDGAFSCSSWAPTRTLLIQSCRRRGATYRPPCFSTTQTRFHFPYGRPYPKFTAQSGPNLDQRLFPNLFLRGTLFLFRRVTWTPGMSWTSTATLESLTTRGGLVCSSPLVNAAVRLQLKSAHRSMSRPLPWSGWIEGTDGSKTEVKRPIARTRPAKGSKRRARPVDTVTSFPSGKVSM
jgi:hypothetical protein